jgi:exopolysaccharide production protein ExoY
MPERKTPVRHTGGDRLPAAKEQKDRRSRGQLVEDTNGKRVVVIGAAADIPRALEHPAVSTGRFAVMSAIAVEPDDACQDVAGLSTILRTTRATTVLIAGPLGQGLMRQVADLAAVYHCDLLAVMPTEVLAEHEPVVVWDGHHPLVQLAGANRRRWEATAKRTIDIVGSLAGLVVAAPVMAALALAVRLESPGSPVFRHERVGYKGRRFLCLKLRTMRIDAEELLRSDPEMYEEYRKHHFKIPEDRDPRVTRLGRFLRKTSLDELPQLWNVLVGEMSIVGPRPVVEEELELYGESKDVMLSVRPGITGAWAVNGRQSLGYPERCETELGYVREWTIVQDVRIMLKTAVIVAGSRREPDQLLERAERGEEG